MAARKKEKTSGNKAVEKVTEKVEKENPQPSAPTPDDKDRLDAAAQGQSAPAAGATVNITTPPEVNPQTDPPAGNEVTDQPAPTDGTPDPATPPDLDDIPPGIADIQKRIENAQAQPPAETRAQARDRAAMERQARTTQSPTTKKLGPLGEKVTGAEHLKIHLRMPNGTKALIGIYNINDFASNQNVETFIYQYIKPSKGPGIYEITLVDAFGREYDAGTVNIDDPVNPNAVEMPPGSNPMDLVKTLIEQQRQDRQDALTRFRSTPERDPVDTLRGVLELKKEVIGDQDEEAKGTLAAMIQAQARQTEAFMNMLVNLQAKSDEKMAALLASSGGTDPVILTLLTKLLDDKTGGDKMPPMPQPVDPTQNLKNLAEVVALLRPEKSDMDSKLLEHFLASQGEKTSLKDMLELVNQLRGEPGSDDFKKAFENWQVMMSAVQSLRQQTDGGGSSGFWEFASALVSNSDLPSTMANVIRAKTGGAPRQQQLPPGVQHHQLAAHSDAAVEADIIDFERRASAIRTRRLDLARRRLDAERQLQEESEALQQEIDRNPNAHKPYVPPSPQQPQQSQQAPETISKPRVATPSQEQAVQRATARTGGRIPQLPPEIAEHLNMLIGSSDDGDLVEGMFRLLFYLAKLEDWRQFAEAVFYYIQQNDKKKVIEFLNSFFEGLEDINLTDKSLRDRVLLVFDRHFADIVTHAQSIKDEMQAQEEEDDEDEENEEEENEVEPENHLPEGA